MKRVMIAMGLAITAAGNLGYRPAPDDRESVPVGICIEGVIEDVSVAPATIWVSGKTVFVPKTAKIEEGAGEVGHFGHLKAGLTVRVCGMLYPDKTIVAMSVQILPVK